MENRFFKLLHAYHPNENAQFAKVDIMVYRDHLILTGYEQLGQPMSSFVHYQFHDLKLPNVYSTQIQMAEDQIPSSYRSAVIKNVFHCEPTYVLVPQAELEGLNSYSAYTATYSEPAEKLLIDDIEAVRSREFYNYPYRVYNDLDFTFENAQFFSYHRPAFDVLKRKSADSDLAFISIKTKFIDIIGFKNGELHTCNTFEVKDMKEAIKSIKSNLKTMKIDTSSENIYITCVQKEQSEAQLAMMKEHFANFNKKAEETFGFPLNFWEVYGDLILCS